MNRYKTENYFPIENLYYSLSLLIDLECNKSTFLFRLLAFADFIENLVLMDEIFYDYGEEELDLKVFDIVDEIGLTDLLKPKKMIKEEMPFTLLPILLSKANPEKINDAFEMIGKNPESLAREFRRYFLSDTYKGINREVCHKQFNYIYDYMKLIFPYYTEGFYNFLSSNRTISITEAFIWFEKNQLTNKEKNEFESGLNLVFQAIVESALVSSIRMGSIFTPLEFQSELLLSKPIFAPSKKIFLEKLTEMKYNELSKLNTFLYNKYSTIVTIPILFNYIMSKSNTIKDVFRIALDLREEKQIRKYKVWCREIDEALKSGFQEEAIRLIQNTNRYIDSILTFTSLPQKFQLQISFPPAVLFELSTPKLKRKNSLIFLKTLYNEALSPIILTNKINKIFNVKI